MANDPIPKHSDLNIAVAARGGRGTVTARQAAGLHDMQLPISPSQVPVAKALQNLAKSINVAFEGGFLENELESVYKGARVRKGTVEIMHSEYIGLGDGIFAKFGRFAKSFQLTFRGPDPASPQGKKLYEEKGRKPIRGLLSLLGRKLDLIQEYEDQVPVYVEQLLDRLESTKIITGWDRDEWKITTQVVGIDVIIAPVGSGKT